MLEYKLPTLATLYGCNLREANLGPVWTGFHRPINAAGISIDRQYVAEELARAGGWRYFHPYLERWVLDA